jgi:hypothetical protein
MILCFWVTLGIDNIRTVFKNLLTTSSGNLCGLMHPKRDFRGIDFRAKVCRVFGNEYRVGLKCGEGGVNLGIRNFMTFFQIGRISRQNSLEF